MTSFQILSKSKKKKKNAGIQISSELKELMIHQANDAPNLQLLNDEFMIISILQNAEILSSCMERQNLVYIQNDRI